MGRAREGIAGACVGLTIRARPVGAPDHEGGIGTDRIFGRRKSIRTAFLTLIVSAHSVVTQSTGTSPSCRGFKVVLTQPAVPLILFCYCRE